MARKTQVFIGKSDFPGISSRNGDTIQLCIPYKNKRIYETVTLQASTTNLRKMNEKRSAIISELKSGTFYYKKHFPIGDNEHRFAKMAGDHISIRDRLVAYKDKMWASSLKHSTKAGYNFEINNIILSFGDKQLSLLTANDLDLWVTESKITQKTLDNRMTHLNKIIVMAMKNKEIQNDVTKGWKLKTLDQFKSIKQKEPFSQVEYSKIMEAMKIIAPDIFSYFLFRFSMGLRACEICAVAWDKYDELNNTIKIDCTMIEGHFEDSTKTPAGMRTLKLNKPALIALNIQKDMTYENGGLIFKNPNTNIQWNNDAITRRWTKALNYAGVKYRKPYNTRHTYATLALKSKNIELYDLSVSLGHADVTTTARAYVGTINDINAHDTSALDAIFTLED